MRFMAKSRKCFFVGLGLIALGLLFLLLHSILQHSVGQELRMTIALGNSVKTAKDISGQVHKLPFAIQLDEFNIEEYPPELFLLDGKNKDEISLNNKGKSLKLDSTFVSGKLGDWKIELVENLLDAAPVRAEDTAIFLPWTSNGSVSAASVKVTNLNNGDVKTGWVSCGNHIVPTVVLPLNEEISLAMAPRDPKTFSSKVSIFTSEKTGYYATTMLKRPVKLDGWNIYQLDYDRQKGKWSDVSVLKLVKDPLQWMVYAGFGILLLGIVLIFVKFVANFKRMA